MGIFHVWNTAVWCYFKKSSNKFNQSINKAVIGYFWDAAVLGNFVTFFLCVCCVSGEVPGLYSPEELEPLLSSLKDAASQDGFTGPLYNYFSYSQSHIFIDSRAPLSLCVAFIIFVFYHHCVVFGTLGLFSRCQSLLNMSLPLIVLSVLFSDCIWLCSSASLLCSGVCRNGTVSLRLRLLLENQINSSIIVKVNPLKSSLLAFTVQLCQQDTSKEGH